LITNLHKDKFPILFEGLHTTFPLLKYDFSNRKVIVRMHNKEDDYYKGLAKSEKNPLKKIFFNFESFKLKGYEKILLKADKILSISPYETKIFTESFFEKVVFIPPFHEHNQVKELSTKGKFAFYHGDTRVMDNIRAVHYLIDVFEKIDYPLIIGGRFLRKDIADRIKNIKNITFENIEENSRLQALFDDTHIHVLPTFQKTGIKLKLINALYGGRFVVGNEFMLSDTGLESICYMAKDKDELKTIINRLSKKEYVKENIEEKQKVLHDFSPIKNAQKIIDLLDY